MKTKSTPLSGEKFVREIVEDTLKEFKKERDDSQEVSVTGLLAILGMAIISKSMSCGIFLGYLDKYGDINVTDNLKSLICEIYQAIDTEEDK